MWRFITSWFNFSSNDPFHFFLTSNFYCKQAGVIEEFVNDAVDTALDSEDMEEEIEEEVDKVLTAIAGETAAQLPEAARKEKMKQPVSTAEEVRSEPEISFALLRIYS